MLGTAASRHSGVISKTTRNRSPSRLCSIARYSLAKSSSCPKATSATMGPSSNVRNSPEICESMRVAREASPRKTSVDTAFSELNRKWGFSWYRRALRWAFRASLSARNNLSRSRADCCHSLMLKYNVHQRKSMTDICKRFTSKSVQSSLTTRRIANSVTKAATVPKAADQTKARSSMPIHGGERRISDRQTGRSKLLARNKAAHPIV